MSSAGVATGVSQPPAELQRHVGDRVWLAGVPDAPPTAFGVIPELPAEGYAGERMLAVAYPKRGRSS